MPFLRGPSTLGDLLSGLTFWASHVRVRSREDGGRVGESPSRGDLLFGLVLRNAREWLSQAKVIHAHEGNNGHVVALACIALEEGAKAFLWLNSWSAFERALRRPLPTSGVG